jgi:hypothetical protein
MKLLSTIQDQPVGLPLVADDITEFHAARLLLLVHVCGKRARIDGLTKMAKLDFFVRYPQFFDKACRHQGLSVEVDTETDPTDVVESAMVRYHYGPWDLRYYDVLAYMRARDLVTINQEGRVYKLRLTDLGRSAADDLAASAAFAPLVTQMRSVKTAFGNASGSALKQLIYDVFDEEVAQRAKGEVITVGH